MQGCATLSGLAETWYVFGFACSGADNLTARVESGRLHQLDRRFAARDWQASPVPGVSERVAVLTRALPIALSSFMLADREVVVVVL
jgi:hypothetical protein